MLINKRQQTQITGYLTSVGLTASSQSNADKHKKVEQILAYLEILHAEINKLSTKKTLYLYECGAGNCYLSYAIQYVYSEIFPRPVVITCIDKNIDLMNKHSQRVKELEIVNMNFHSGEVQSFCPSDPVDVVYSLHACDLATDQTLSFAILHKARRVLSVSCCQHSIIKAFSANGVMPGVSQHQAIKQKFCAYIGDTMRSLILETNGYQTHLIEFVSARSTEKNIMLRARRTGQVSNTANQSYETLKNNFGITPKLAEYVA